jgi:prevent-host-death family protein
MERVGVRELRQNLSIYLRRVRRGESLEVTERGEPVAVLQPTPSTKDPLAALAARGVAIRRGRGNLADLAAPVPLRRDRSVSEALQELREDRL